MNYGWVEDSKLVWILVKLTSNRPMQRCLGAIQHYLQHLQGIGTGSVVRGSGESYLPAMLLKSGDRPLTVVDVGANDGDFIKAVCKTLPPADRLVIGIEPIQSTFSRLSANVGNERGVVLHRLAFGRVCGTRPMYSCGIEGGYKLASFTPTQNELSAEMLLMDKVEDVEVTRLDKFCAEQSIARIDLLKIDVEGHELEVLQSAERLFVEGAVRMVSLEFSFRNVDTKVFFRDIFEFLTTHRMKVYRLTRSGYLFPIEVYSGSQEQFRTTIFVGIRDTA